MNGTGAGTSFDLHQGRKHGPALGLGGAKDRAVSEPTEVMVGPSHSRTGLHQVGDRAVSVPHWLGSREKTPMVSMLPNRPVRNSILLKYRHFLLTIS